jgi:FKBP-type peptidyl-prolyl cis-trans isomerase FklB
VLVDFRGLLLDGTEFDSSKRRGAVSRFRVDEAIPGLQDVLQAMEEGGKWEVYVPTELAFRQPSPFSGQTVVFEIELVAIEGRQARVPASPPAAAAAEDSRADGRR